MGPPYYGIRCVLCALLDGRMHTRRALSISAYIQNHPVYKFRELYICIDIGNSA